MGKKLQLFVTHVTPRCHSHVTDHKTSAHQHQGGKSRKQIFIPFSPKYFWFCKIGRKWPSIENYFQEHLRSWEWLIDWMRSEGSQWWGNLRWHLPCSGAGKHCPRERLQRLIGPTSRKGTSSHLHFASQSQWWHSVENAVEARENLKSWPALSALASTVNSLYH